MNDLVTVIIPAFNASNYLVNAIESVLAQTYPFIELIVVNDGSDDDNKTEKIAKSYEGKLVYIYQKNAGVSAALNTGIKASSGKWIAWLSHDDCFHPKKIEFQLAYLKANSNIDICYTDYNVIDNRGKIQGQVNLPYYEPKCFTIHLIQAMFVCGSTVILKKKSFDDSGYFNENLRYAQDAEFWVRLSKKNTFGHLSDKLTNWRFHENQGSKNLKAMKLDKQQYLSIVLDKISINEFFIGQETIENFEAKSYRCLALIMLRCHRETKLALNLFKKSYSYWKSIRNPSFFYILFLITFGIIYYESAIRVAYYIRKNTRKNKKIPKVEFIKASNRVNINL